MRKLGLFFILFVSVNVLYANSVLSIQKGWQLVGVSIPVEDMKLFDHDAIEEVWHFDAESQSWRGYSPKQDIADKMSDKQIDTLERLENWHGFWIKSSHAWTLTLEDTDVQEVNASAKDIIVLKKGWNLISLPVDTVVSPHIFKAYTVLKFNSDDKWEFFDENNTSENIAALDHIKNSDGFWLKADEDANISVSEASSKLKTFQSMQEMENYLKEMITIQQRPICGIEPFSDGFVSNDVANEIQDTPTAEVVDSSTEVREASNTSGTNLQEDAVDEADIVKHNGKHIFYLDENKQKVLVSTFEALNENNKEPLYSIEPDFISKHPRIHSLYLVNERLVIVASGYDDYRSSSDIYIYDVQSIQDPQLIHAYKVEGGQVTSRMIENRLFLVSAFYPSVKIQYPKVMIDDLPGECTDSYYGSAGAPVNVNDLREGETSISDALPYIEYACYGIYADQNGSYYRYDYDNPIYDEYVLTPNITNEANQTQNLVSYDRLYAPLKLDQRSALTTISSFDIQSGAYEKSTSYIGNSSNQYASINAFYLVSSDYPHFVDFRNYKQRSFVYKFNLDVNLTYGAKGSVYGRVLNQFSLSEYDEVLRIATTEGFSWGGGDTNNLLYTLGHEENTLYIKGVLSGLGKEGEVIESVRFIGDKAFIVTFRQTDPLYAIDLSDASNPTILGELEVNGYSDYLHPIGEDKLLGIGRDADAEGRVKGLKIELFDISDLSAPHSLDSIILNSYTYSELEHNHKAFSFRANDNLFAVPYSQYGYQNSHSYLGVYQIVEDRLKTYDPVENNTEGYSYGDHRGIFFDMDETTQIASFNNGTVTVNTIDTNTTKK